MVAAWRTVRHELEAYGGGLIDKTELIALNKSDSMSPREASSRATALRRASGAEVAVISGVSGDGVPALLRRLQDVITAERARRGDTTERAERAGAA